MVTHPDDESLGMGATIAKLAQAGHEVWLAAIADGEQSRGVSAVLVMQRLEQFTKAAKTLGARVYLENAPFQDQRLDTVPLLEIAKTVKRIVDAVNPSIVYTHTPHDLNQDHVAVHRATMIACRPQPGQCVKALYTYEVPETTNWAFGQWGQWQPNVFVAVTETLETKIDAMNCYESERRPWPHPRSPEALRYNARRWGSMVGVTAAEVFQCIWKIE